MLYLNLIFLADTDKTKICTFTTEKLTVQYLSYVVTKRRVNGYLTV